MKMLVVEDDFGSRRVMQKLLEPYGDVDVVVDGEEAVDAFKLAWEEAKPYDIIFMDIMMPKMDGHEALKRLRELEREMGVLPANEARVIMTSVLEDPKNVIQAYYGGSATRSYQADRPRKARGRAGAIRREPEAHSVGLSRKGGQVPGIACRGRVHRRARYKELPRTLRLRDRRHVRVRRGPARGLRRLSTRPHSHGYQASRELDGVETARLVHERYGTPVVLLTAFADDETIARAKITQPFGYLIKPFEERELKVLIEIALYRAVMEKKLTESEARYRNLFQEGISGNFLADREGLVLEANPAFRDLVGLGPATPLPRLETLVADQAAMSAFRETLQSGRRLSCSSCRSGPSTAGTSSSSPTPRRCTTRRAGSPA